MPRIEHEGHIAIKSPTTLLEDYFSYSREQKALKLREQLGELTSNEFDIELRFLHERYRDRVNFKDDCYTFNSIKDLTYFLHSLGAGNLFENMVHEVEHAAEIVSLGYEINYGTWLLRGNDGSINYAPFVSVPGILPSGHYNAIRLAPHNPSSIDLGDIR